MKNYLPPTSWIVVIVIILLSCFGCNSQTPLNHSTKPKLELASMSSSVDHSQDSQVKLNSHWGILTIKSIKYDVFCGSTNVECSITGSLYINRVSKKTGKPYKRYLTDEEKKLVNPDYE